MPRFAGVDIPRNKVIGVSLTYIYGIGPTTAKKILAAAGVDETVRASELTDEQETAIRTQIDAIKTEGDLRLERRLDIKRLMEIGSYRGLRHRRSLPVRGQRTKTNARTRKGPRRTVANKNKKVVTRKKKAKRNVAKGVAHIHSTFNNTIVTITDEGGNAVSWSSAGALGYKGSRKSTPYVAQLVSEAAGKAAVQQGMKSVEVNVKGPGAGREAAVRSLQTAGLTITAINDVTPIPHNGCRPPKRPRG